jgi:hypothetical protein
VACTTSKLPVGVKTNKVSRPTGRLYTLVALTIRRTYLFALAILVTAFVALYPYLGAKDMCDSGKCPMVTQSTSGGVSTACLIVALVAAPALMRFGSERRLRGATSELRPIQVFSSPDPPPPRSFS